jgi:hypothetical protein
MKGKGTFVKNKKEDHFKKMILFCLNIFQKNEKYLKVPGIGLEPIRPQWTQDFKSCVSTNSTTWASTSGYGSNPDHLKKFPPD